MQMVTRLGDHDYDGDDDDDDGCMTAAWADDKASDPCVPRKLHAWQDVTTTCSHALILLRDLVNANNATCAEMLV